MQLPDTFTAIDFETAHHERWSICSIGLVRVEKGQVVKEIDQLIQPPDNYYLDRFTGIHGISSTETAFAPTFAEAWPGIAPYIINQDLVAHNGLRFDFPALRKTLAYYHLLEPPFRPHCTYKIYGRGLGELCQEYAIDLAHHQALSDARACATLFTKWLARAVMPPESDPTLTSK